MEDKKEDSTNNVLTAIFNKKIKKKKFKQNLFLLFITLFIMIILIEFSLRIFYPQKLYNECYEYSYNNLDNLEIKLDSLIGWITKSNFTGCGYEPDINKIFYKNHNSKGLRLGNEIEYAKSDKKRVLLLGDSFIYGYGVNDSNTIGAQFQKILGEKYEVIPMGVDGFGTGQELLYLKKEGLKYNPNIVILFFYPNDFTETEGGESFAEKPVMISMQDLYTILESNKETIIKNIHLGLLKESSVIYLLDGLIYPNLDKFKLINETLNDESIIVFNYTQAWSNGAGLQQKSLSEKKPISSFFLKYSHFYSLIYHTIPKLNFNSKIKYPDRITDGIDVFIEKEHNPFVENSIFLILKLFNKIKELSLKNNFDFIVVNIPEKRNINKGSQEKFLNQYSDVDETFFEFDKIDKIFNEELPKREIEYISLYELAKNNFDDFYFKTDPHWNPKGINLSANYIKKELEKKDII